MAAKKKKSTTKPYGNKTKFVLGLSRDLSAKEVVSEAKKNGITITEAHVYKIRSTAKAKGGKGASRPTKASKSATKKSVGRATKASRAATPTRATKGRSSKSSKASAGVSKRDFVLSFGSETAASEILRKAKEAGVGLSKAYLYTIRSAAGPAPKRGAAKGRKSSFKSDAKAAYKSARGSAGRLEAQFLEAARDLGLSKASALLSRLRKSF
jgi:hypothetical protein